MEENVGNVKAVSKQKIEANEGEEEVGQMKTKTRQHSEENEQPESEQKQSQSRDRDREGKKQETQGDKTKVEWTLKAQTSVADRVSPS